MPLLQGAESAPPGLLHRARAAWDKAGSTEVERLIAELKQINATLLKQLDKGDAAPAVRQAWSQREHLREVWTKAEHVPQRFNQMAAQADESGHALDALFMPDIPSVLDDKLEALRPLLAPLIGDLALMPEDKAMQQKMQSPRIVQRLQRARDGGLAQNRFGWDSSTEWLGNPLHATYDFVLLQRWLAEPAALGSLTAGQQSWLRLEAGKDEIAAWEKEADLPEPLSAAHGDYRFALRPAFRAEKPSRVHAALALLCPPEAAPKKLETVKQKDALLALLISEVLAPSQGKATETLRWLKQAGRVMPVWCRFAPEERDGTLRAWAERADLETALAALPAGVAAQLHECMFQHPVENFMDARGKLLPQAQGWTGWTPLPQAQVTAPSAAKPAAKKDEHPPTQWTLLGNWLRQQTKGRRVTWLPTQLPAEAWVAFPDSIVLPKTEGSGPESQGQLRVQRSATEPQHLRVELWLDGRAIEAGPYDLNMKAQWGPWFWMPKPGLIFFVCLGTVLLLLLFLLLRALKGARLQGIKALHHRGVTALLASLAGVLLVLGMATAGPSLTYSSLATDRIIVGPDHRATPPGLRLLFEEVVVHCLPHANGAVLAEAADSGWFGRLWRALRATWSGSGMSTGPQAGGQAMLRVYPAGEGGGTDPLVSCALTADNAADVRQQLRRHWKWDLPGPGLPPITREPAQAEVKRLLFSDGDAGGLLAGSSADQISSGWLVLFTPTPSRDARAAVADLPEQRLARLSVDGRNGVFSTARGFPGTTALDDAAGSFTLADAAPGDRPRDLAELRKSWYQSLEQDAEKRARLAESIAEKLSAEGESQEMTALLSMPLPVAARWSVLALLALPAWLIARIASLRVRNWLCSYISAPQWWHVLLLVLAGLLVAMFLAACLSVLLAQTWAFGGDVRLLGRFTVILFALVAILCLFTLRSLSRQPRQVRGLIERPRLETAMALLGTVLAGIAAGWLLLLPVRRYAEAWLPSDWAGSLSIGLVLWLLAAGLWHRSTTVR
ncbi:hypothetical protein [Prosthecobacter sp.]|uniref:hypothetical protein n=1 Tax=Prosthecobacter sp. TaxID=1965333 RepID=UPI003783ED93